MMDYNEQMPGDTYQDLASVVLGNGSQGSDSWGYSMQELFHEIMF